jgi:hypothetical protein
MVRRAKAFGHKVLEKFGPGFVGRSEPIRKNFIR